MKERFYKQYLLRIYRFWSKHYDGLIEPRWKFDRGETIDKLEISKGDKIVEIGVGTGLNLPYYPTHCEVMGIDFSPEMLEAAKEKKHYAKVILKIQDGRLLSFPDNYFDKALATYVLRVSPEPEKIVKEISRVVKKGGIFCIVDKFKGKTTIISLLHRFFLFLGGGGKDYSLETIVKNSPWKIIHNKPFGTRKNTHLIIFKNEK